MLEVVGKWARLPGDETIAVFVVRDITQAKRLESERSQAYLGLGQSQNAALNVMEDLAREVAERQIVQEQLHIANIRLKDISSLKDEFIAMASHELRNPLTAINEGIHLVLDQALGPINEDQKTFLGDVAENIDRLTELINTMLDLSKLQAGRLRLERRRVDLHTLIETTVKNYRALAGRRTLTAEVESPMDVFADPHRILQVLGNFVSNAIKCTREDGAIHILLHPQDGRIAVSVHDDGAGVAAEDLPKLFKKFSQVGDGHARRKGTGLGLSLCKELIELHKGEVSVASEVGTGSTFTFTLPCYGPHLALEESWNERLETDHDASNFGIIARHLERALELRRGSGPNEPTQELLTEAAKTLRQHLQEKDVRIPMEPSWLVIFAAADRDAMQAIAKRLQDRAREWAQTGIEASEDLPIPTGVACYPADGANTTLLLAAAVKRAAPDAAPPSSPCIKVVKASPA